MIDNFGSLNCKYDELINELFEEVLCDNCRRTIKLGNAEAKIINLVNNNTLFLCRDCNDKIMNQIRKI
ncbi:hypothetical protein COX58_00920 [archaeon CG_4_10_14_0_2_um_filter_Archaea_38_6]|nr:MAG: hypothetical protein COS83_04660 [archaeon CG07_land_8_20_14_0_80_38_8]PIU88696.1 MAG: hypothetical protein COS64_02985 [archaeon CG06_land_8_20_14_3_00_37_11]PIX42602.1 MAG: hypothetical protein COZ55_01930 [archaeon CG_4_8_14_3_um_filter_38_5]PJA22889.1 MAG: hypothetical protein COX58_00920 [archaeon CG_4_10_14_0_2_um_filter_Archaea_38_6]